MIYPKCCLVLRIYVKLPDGKKRSHWGTRPNSILRLATTRWTKALRPLDLEKWRRAVASMEPQNDLLGVFSKRPRVTDIYNSNQQYMIKLKCLCLKLSPRSHCWLSFSLFFTQFWDNPPGSKQHLIVRYPQKYPQSRYEALRMSGASTVFLERSETTTRTSSKDSISPSSAVKISYLVMEEPKNNI